MSDGQLKVEAVLIETADPEAAHRLVGEHVLMFPARRVRVELVRYRPGSRAVLRHRVGRVKLYARVMRPAALGPLLAGAMMVSMT